MANNIVIKNANGVSVEIHTIEDSTSVHYNMSIPITTSGGLLFTDLAGTVSVLNQVSLAPQTFNTSVQGVVSVHPNGTINWPVSVAGTVTVSIGAQTSPIAVSAEGGFLDSVLNVRSLFSWWK